MFLIRMSVTDSDAGHLEGEGKAVRKRTKKERKRTNLGPRIKVLRRITNEDGDVAGSVEDGSKTGVKVECQMESSKERTVTFEFHTTDIDPDEMATTFIREDLLAEEHRTSLVYQLVDIVNKLNKNPDQIPTVSFPPEECFSPTRDKRDQSSEATKSEQPPPAESQPPVQPQEPPQTLPPVRGAEKPPDVQVTKRFHISPVVENKPIVPPVATSTPATVEMKDSSTITTQTKIDTATSPYHEEIINTSVDSVKTKLEKLDISKPTPASMPSLPGNVTSSLSPNTEQPKTAPVTSGLHNPAQVSPNSTAAAVGQPFLTSPEGPHYNIYPNSDVSDLEANLKMVFNKTPAPTVAPVVSNVPGIKPLDVVVNDDPAGAGSSTIVQTQITDNSNYSDVLTVVSETDQGATSGSSNQGTVHSVHSTKSLDDCLGEPVIQSTPVVTPDKSQELQTVPNSRFAVEKITEDTQHLAEEPELTALSLSQTLNYHRVAEAEHYDSSPSPGSCYDTASESVEPNLLNIGTGPAGQAQVQSHVIHGSSSGQAIVTQAPRYVLFFIIYCIRALKVERIELITDLPDLKSDKVFSREATLELALSVCL